MAARLYGVSVPGTDLRQARGGIKLRREVYSNMICSGPSDWLTGEASLLRNKFKPMPKVLRMMTSFYSNPREVDHIIALFTVQSKKACDVITHVRGSLEGHKQTLPEKGGLAIYTESPYYNGQVTRVSALVLEDQDGEAEDRARRMVVFSQVLFCKADSVKLYQDSVHTAVREVGGSVLEWTVYRPSKGEYFSSNAKPIVRLLSGDESMTGPTRVILDYHHEGGPGAFHKATPTWSLEVNPTSLEAAMCRIEIPLNAHVLACMSPGKPLQKEMSVGLPDYLARRERPYDGLAFLQVERSFDKNGQPHVVAPWQLVGALARSSLLRDVMSGASSLFTPGRLERIFPGSLKARADPFWKRVAEECNYCEPYHPDRVCLKAEFRHFTTQIDERANPSFDNSCDEEDLNLKVTEEARNEASLRTDAT